MKITKDNINSAECGAFFTHIVNLIKYLTPANGIVSLCGNIIKQYMIPCQYHLYDWENYASLEIIISKYDEVDFSKIHFYIDDSDGTIENNDNKDDKYNVTKRFKKNIEDKIKINFPSLTLVNIHRNGYVYESTYTYKSIYTNDIILTIIAIDFNSYHSFIFAIDYFKYSEELLWLDIKYSNTLTQWAIETVPQLMINKKIKDNIDFKKHVYQTAVYRYIINEYMNKKTNIVKKYMIDPAYIDLLETEMNYLISNGYTIVDSSFSRNRMGKQLENCTCEDHLNKCTFNDDECSICKDTIQKNQLVTELICKHVFHLTCISKWAYNNDENLVKCPLCRSSNTMNGW
jgi:hypothetical protein